MDIRDILRDRDVPDITIVEKRTCQVNKEVFEYETLFSVVHSDGIMYVERKSRVLTDDDPKWGDVYLIEAPISDIDTLISGFERIKQFLLTHVGEKDIHNI